MFYNCLLAVEKICQKEFDADSSKLNDGKHSILEKAQDDVDVKFYWDLAIGLTSTEIEDELLRMVIDLYTTVRGNAFAKGFMEQYKQKNKKAHRIKGTLWSYNLFSLMVAGVQKTFTLAQFLTRSLQVGSELVEPILQMMAL